MKRASANSLRSTEVSRAVRMGLLAEQARFELQLVEQLSKSAQ